MKGQPMTIAQDDAVAAARKDRIEQLQRKLAARENNPAYKENCEQIRKEIERLSWFDL